MDYLDGGKRKKKAAPKKKKATSKAPKSKAKKGGCATCFVGGAGPFRVSDLKAAMNPTDLYEGSPVLELKLIKDYMARDAELSDIGQNLELINPLIKRSGQSLIVFYSPNCVHCVNLKDTLVGLAEKVKKLGIPVGAVNVNDVLNNNDLFAEYFKIKYYPTILWYKNGEYTIYDADKSRDIDSLMNFVCTMSGLCVPGQKQYF
jgi:thiol-disulfide isomerase/thioredoxin